MTDQSAAQRNYPNAQEMFTPQGEQGKPVQQQPSGRAMLQNRAASFRYAADQIDRLLGMTPAELTPEQEQALLFLGQNTQFVF